MMGEQIQADTALGELAFLAKKELTALEAAGYTTAASLLDHLPKRYEDRRVFDAFPAQAGAASVSLRGMVVDTKNRFFGAKRTFYEAVVRAGGETVFSSNTVTCRWFNMPYVARMLASGHEVVLYGRPKDHQGKIVIDHPEFEIVKGDDPDSIHLDRIVPVYRAISGVPQRRLREIQYALTERLDDDSGALPDGTSRSAAWRNAHFPAAQKDADLARRAMALEEFYLLQLRVLQRRREATAQAGRVQAKSMALLTDFYQSLPFDLTDAQKRTVREIIADMRAPRPMNRLLQGDVGSGKTFVALCAMLLAVDSGAQAALMAPTQILAEQHYLTFQKWLEPLGVRVALFTGAREEKTHLDIEGEPQILIGTHALLFDRVKFSELGLVVIDEQHKFGVMQRGALIDQGTAPDVLVMTATPIPRTLTLTIYGDLDVSILDERPAGRGKVVTALRVKPKIPDVTKFLKTQLEAGRQIYLVYPLVEDSETVKAASAVEEHPKWQKRLKNFDVGLLHGKMKPEEKDAIMTRFRDGKSEVLVATTVIEVGVDVPNANVMVIYNADRFGLAQLHQLRGRIGRGEHKSFCILVTDGKNPVGVEKLEVLAATDDGFKIAEEDLRLRGPGEVLGTQQSGLSTLRFVDFLADTALIRQARALAEKTLADTP